MAQSDDENRATFVEAVAALARETWAPAARARAQYRRELIVYLFQLN